MENRKVIRVLIAKPGLDGHDRGAKVVAKALRDAGMEVIYTGLRQSVDQIVGAAIQEDVQVIGLSILSGTHVSLVRKLMQRLETEGMKDEVQVLVGGNIPRRDFEELEKLGVDQVFTTGTKLKVISEYLQNTLVKVG
ncbi:cobalamin B12-binding domain-containing protein [Metallumcola ferriviriculae]|uniref:Cobalamin B12-binding domain-containing protein n=1 Tax=Metallumcola ferriviriculae TaxID=3039180 RepID=A0AAU0URG5_9FIRM|nr:cobalamin B12-binding domain-containing protein [Desulfitibacteraceae bacterium MK1]